jgi:hypothetical protein
MRAGTMVGNAGAGTGVVVGLREAPAILLR